MSVIKGDKRGDLEARAVQLREPAGADVELWADFDEGRSKRKDLLVRRFSRVDRRSPAWVGVRCGVEEEMGGRADGQWRKRGVKGGGRFGRSSESIVDEEEL